MTATIAGACTTIFAAAACPAAMIQPGDFTPTTSESFEGVTPGFKFAPLSVFGGSAVMTSEAADGLYVTSSQFDANWVFAQDGAKLAGAPQSATVYTFSTPMHVFGGWFANALLDEGGRIEFYDASGQMLASELLDAPSAYVNGADAWAWNGFAYDDAFTSVVIRGSHASEGLIMQDALVASSVPVPAPGVIAMLAGAGAMTLGRRRR